MSTGEKRREGFEEWLDPCRGVGVVVVVVGVVGRGDVLFSPGYHPVSIIIEFSVSSQL